MARIFKTPFAAQGDKDVVPVPPQGDGSVSMTQGFGYDYEREYEDPAAKDIRRETMNGLFHDLTEALGELQNFGFAEWQPVDGGWPIGANVRHADGYWQSLANANTEEPGTGPLWKELLFGNLVPASETIRGVIQLATTAQAQALTADGVVITPKKLGDAMNAHVLGMGQTWQDMTASRSAGTNYTNTTGRTIAISVHSVPSKSEKTQLNLDINGSVTSRSAVPGANFGDGTNAWLFGIIPPGATYKVVEVSGSIQIWRELR